MARRELGPDVLRVVQAVSGWLTVPGQPVLVACSGGADSMALAAAVAHLSRRVPELAGRVSARVIDHGLQHGSGVVAETVAARLASLGLPCEVRGVDVDPDSTAGLEAAARDARYLGLAADCSPGTLVLLGHTLDDQAETVLLGLARGSGTRSMAGMPPRFTDPATGVDFGRPLLGLRREHTAQACQQWLLPIWYDPHNYNKRFTRVRVRTSVLPTLEAELGPGVTEALARTASLARIDADELDAQAAVRQPPPGEGLAVALLQELPEALASRVLRGWLIAGGVAEPSHAHVQAVWSLVEAWRGQAGIDVPGDSRVVRRDATLWLVDKGRAAGAAPDG
jgi:tRNA(Ile)-lysidine synthase